MASGRKSPSFVGKIKPHVSEDRLTDSMGVPGPGKYYNPSKTSAFGRQQKSQKKSMATTKFGTSKRAGIKKIYLGKEQAAKNPSKYTEEVGIKHISSIGKQSMSKKKTNPSVGFSKSSRFTSHYADPTKNVKYPVGPSSMTKQAISTKKSSPSFGFGQGGRSNYHKQYLSKGHQAKMISTTTANVAFNQGTRGMGKQSDSRKKTKPSFGFGTSGRGHSTKLYRPSGAF
jgi:hypothetical protein